MVLQGLVEEASDAVVAITDANDNVGFGSDSVISVAGAAFGEFGNFGCGLAVGEEIGLFVGLLKLRNGRIGGFFAEVDGRIDGAVVVIGVGEMRIANFADKSLVINDGFFDWNAAGIGFDLLDDVGIVCGSDAWRGSLSLIEIKVDCIFIVA